MTSHGPLSTLRVPSMRVIAELGQNTNGDLTTALRMVDAAAEAGADGVKVQAYDTGDFLPVGHPDWAMFEGNRLTWDEIEFVRVQAVQSGLEFGATPTSVEGVRRLAEMRVDFLKNGSDFLLRRDVLEAMCDTGIETWAAIGMADYLELPRDLPVRFMACTSEYPCAPVSANLARLKLERVDGYSDHTDGCTAAVMAVALGAEMLEKHFTLDRGMVGPDHSFSADPAGLTELVQRVREAELMVGHGRIEPTAAERGTRAGWRVSDEQPTRRAA